MRRCLPNKSHKTIRIGGSQIPKTFKLKRTIEDSSILIKTDLFEAAEAAFQNIKKTRNDLKKYSAIHPEFIQTLEPIKIRQGAPEVVKRMSDAAQKAKVGPMAAVAGAIADLAAEEMEKHGAKLVVVEDGGEIAIRRSDKLDVAIYAGGAQISGKLGFRILQKDVPLGIGTSSATVGHAKSFGSADAATVIAYDAALADAAATAVCNAVVGEDINESVKKGLRVAQSIEGARGALIIRGGSVGMVGHIPKLISIK
jgi:ApbE superfamily uncharacterized protein (UPF0280 family)